MGRVRSYFEALLDQHARLQESVQDLRAQVAPGMTGDATAPSAAALSTQLVALQDLVVQHFREEEASGIFEQLEAEHPEAQPVLQALRADHDRILADLRGLIGTVVLSPQEPPASAALCRWTVSVLDRLQLHDREETGFSRRLKFGETSAEM